MWYAYTTSIPLNSSNGKLTEGGTSACYSSNEIYISRELGSAASITILSPNGGEKWEIGKAYNVLWNYSGPKECRVSIILTNVKGGMSYGGNNLPISASLGKYSFMVSDNISTGSDIYRMEVIGGKGCPSDESDRYFSIVSSTTQPSITVLSPNGGEKWSLPFGRPVDFRATGVERVNIDLEDWRNNPAGGPLTWRLESNLPVTSAGKYAVISLSDLMPKVQPSDYFKVRVWDASGTESSYSRQISDSSDNYFSIVASSTQP